MKRTSEFDKIQAMLKSFRKSRRIDAVKALCAINNEQAVNTLIETAKDKSWKVRKEAEKALRDHGKNGVWGARVIDQLIETLMDKHMEVVEEAEAALIEIGCDAVDALIDVINKRSVPIGKAASVLGHIGDTKATIHLIRVLKIHESSGMDLDGERVAEALGLVGDEKAIEPLINRL